MMLGIDARRGSAREDYHGGEVSSRCLTALPGGVWSGLFVERIEELAVMAGMNMMHGSNRSKNSPERIASFGAEQRRLKAAAAGRRAAAAAGGQSGQALPSRPERSPAVARRSKYLR
jgi:hypothetical protein